ncbi:hypothetical protein PENSPDRAFT_688736 [Peniophora sp. CONT]|nr:hypothetical protein PENSPDRAFT_688736 [Peniophora sp. CONT]
MSSPSAAPIQVLSTPELLDRVLSGLEREELVQPALVNRLWAETARDYIWEVVDNPCELFRILSPIEHEPEHVFRRVATLSDWQRFLPIARRVRTLKFDNTDTVRAGSCSTRSCRNLLDPMTRTRPSVEIFPRLADLWWWDLDEPEGEPEHMAFFLAPNVTSLRLYSPTGSDWYTPCMIFDDIIARCPRLNVLNIKAGTYSVPPHTVIQNGISRILERLPLRFLHLPLYYLSTQMLEAASRSTTLQELTSQHNEWFNSLGECGRYSNVQDMETPKLGPGSFANLSTLNIAAPLRTVAHMLGDDHFSATNLEILYVRAVKAETASDITTLLTVLQNRCQGLMHLSLFLSRPRDPKPFRENVSDSESDDEEEDIFVPWAEPPRSEILTSTVLKLLDFPRLTQLEISHEYILSITNDEFAAMVEATPNLRYLNFNAAPGNVDPGIPALTLHCLHHAALRLRKLMDLALVVDATQELDADVPVATFRKLDTLFLCTSPIRETERKSVTLHLARTLPTGAELLCDREWMSECDFTPPAFEPERLAIWQRIGEDLELILNAKREWVRDGLKRGKKKKVRAFSITARVSKTQFIAVQSFQQKTGG